MADTHNISTPPPAGTVQLLSTTTRLPTSPRNTLVLRRENVLWLQPTIPVFLAKSPLLSGVANKSLLEDPSQALVMKSSTRSRSTSLVFLELTAPTLVLSTTLSRNPLTPTLSQAAVKSPTSLLTMMVITPSIRLLCRTSAAPTPSTASLCPSSQSQMMPSKPVASSSRTPPRLPQLPSQSHPSTATLTLLLAVTATPSLPTTPTLEDPLTIPMPVTTEACLRSTFSCKLDSTKRTFFHFVFL